MLKDLPFSWNKEIDIQPKKVQARMFFQQTTVWWSKNAIFFSRGITKLNLNRGTQPRVAKKVEQYVLSFADESTIENPTKLVVYNK